MLAGVPHIRDLTYVIFVLHVDRVSLKVCRLNVSTRVEATSNKVGRQPNVKCGKDSVSIVSRLDFLRPQDTKEMRSVHAPAPAEPPNGIGIRIRRS